MKKALIFFFVALLIFFVIQTPVEAATIVRELAVDLWDFFVSAAQAFSTFLRTLF